jgi:hypothetical protein
MNMLSEAFLTSEYTHSVYVRVKCNLGHTSQSSGMFLHVSSFINLFS